MEICAVRPVILVFKPTPNEDRRYWDAIPANIDSCVSVNGILLGLHPSLQSSRAAAPRKQCEIVHFVSHSILAPSPQDVLGRASIPNAPCRLSRVSCCVMLWQEVLDEFIVAPAAILGMASN